MISATLASDNSLRFKQNLSNVFMIIDDKNGDGNLQYDIDRESAKVCGILSGKIDKYEHLTGEEVLKRNIRTSFGCILSFRKSFWKINRKTGFKSLDLSNKIDERKQIEGLFPQNVINDLIRFTLKGITNCKILLKKDYLNYKNRVKTQSFSKCSLPVILNEECLSLEDADNK